ncbi:MAG: peptidase S41 [Saprospiraceae bacterium]|nr:peptidase S41 [Saprospiraceae bacterium]
MTRRICLFLISITCLLAVGKAQSAATDWSSTTFSKAQYLEDYQQFIDTILNTHPHPFKFTPERLFLQRIQAKKELISDQTTLREYIWYCSEIMALLGCSHSSLGWFNQEDAMVPIAQRFPLEAKLIEGRLYISDPLNNRDSVDAGTEIFSINGQPISEITAIAFKHINSQAHISSYKRLLFDSYITSYIPFVLNFPRGYEIIVRGQERPIQLAPLVAYKNKSRYHRITSNSHCKEDLCLELKHPAAAVLTIKRFAYYGDRLSTYTNFIDSSFAEIQTHDIQHLIIDLRFNGGGPSTAANHLLKYLVDKPYVYFHQNDFGHLKEEQLPNPNTFKGKLYFLIDGEGHSTTGHFMSLVKALRKGTIIGEELGSNHFCTANQKKFSLTHTGISFHVARNTFVTAAKASIDSRGILPDHFVTQSITDHLNNVDTVLEYTFNLILQSKD